MFSKLTCFVGSSLSLFLFVDIQVILIMMPWCVVRTNACFFLLVSTNPNAIFIHNDQKPDTLIDLFGILFSISTFSIFTFFFCFFWEQQSVSAPLVAPIYFATYIIAVFFILMNMMISIIIMGFEQAKSEQASKQNLYGQSFFFVSSLFFQFTMFCFFFFFFVSQLSTLF